MFSIICGLLTVLVEGPGLHCSGVGVTGDAGVVWILVFSNRLVINTSGEFSCFECIDSELPNVGLPSNYHDLGFDGYWGTSPLV